MSDVEFEQFDREVKEVLYRIVPCGSLFAQYIDERVQADDVKRRMEIMEELHKNGPRRDPLDEYLEGHGCVQDTSDRESAAVAFNSEGAVIPETELAESADSDPPEFGG